MHKDVKSGFLREELPCGRANGGEIGEVYEDELYSALARGTFGLEAGDCGVDFGLRPRGDVDRCVFGIQHLGELVAHADGGAGDDVDLGGVSLLLRQGSLYWRVPCPGDRGDAPR